MADEWDVTKPVDHTLISDLPGQHRSRKTDTKAVIEKEHRTLGDGNSGAEHKQGSAISYFLATASAPTLRPDGSTALTIEDAGRLWFDTTTHELKVLISVGPLVWKILPSTAAAIALLSTLDIAGDFSVATNKATIAAASGNTAIAGTLEATGLTTVADGSVTKTDAAPTTDTMIPNKKYVDDKDALVGSSGRGFIKAWVSFNGNTGNINGTGFNITSVVKDSPGVYTITWDTDFADDDYAIAGFVADSSNSSGMVCNTASNTPLAAGSAVVITRDTGGTIQDYDLVTVIAIGDQA